MPKAKPTIQQCIAINKTKKGGVRCKRKTNKTSYCYQHLKLLKHVEIKKSNIKNGGLGLCSLKDVPRGQKIAPYGGVLLYGQPEENNDSKYILELTRRNNPVRRLVRATPEPSYSILH
jgi:hypothetical protein